MSEPIQTDHHAEAESLMREALRHTDQSTDQIIALARVHATLAVALAIERGSRLAEPTTAIVPPSETIAVVEH